jgi:hypothetical protein
VGEQDGLLALDRDGDGKITRLSEISFIGDKVGAKTDMEGLQAYDSNGDGVLDAKDARWGEFRIWRDANGNGRGAGKELMTLAEAGITSLSLSLTPTGFTKEGMTDNLSLNTAVFTRSDGTQGTAHDVALATRLANAKGLGTGEKRSEWKRGLTDGEFGVLKAQNGKALSFASVSKGATAPEQRIRIDKNDANDGKGSPKKITPKKGSLSDVAEEQRKGTVAGPSAGPGAPIIIDLGGDGADLIAPDQSVVWHDLNSDGWSDRLGWVGASDAILALDRNGNGRIEVLDEISFLSDKPGAISDLDGLSAFDSDADGILSAADARFGEFLLWRDINQDGFSQAEELQSLAEAGLVSLDLTLVPGAALPDAPLDNVVLRTTTAQFADGQARTAFDVALGSQSGLALALAGAGVDPSTLSSEPLSDGELPGRGLTPWSLSRDLRRLLSEGPRDLGPAPPAGGWQPYSEVSEVQIDPEFSWSRTASPEPSLVGDEDATLSRSVTPLEALGRAENGADLTADAGAGDPGAASSDLTDGPQDLSEPAYLAGRGRSARWWMRASGLPMDGQPVQGQSLAALIDGLQSATLSGASIAPGPEAPLTDLTRSIDQLRQSMAALGGSRGGEAALSDGEAARRLRNPAQIGLQHWRPTPREFA